MSGSSAIAIHTDRATRRSPTNIAAAGGDFEEMTKTRTPASLVKHAHKSNMSTVEPTTSNSPFLKQLASSNSLTRAKALDHLRQYLRTHASLGPLEHLKLWKGLFYSVWHSDRPRAQQALARDLAALVHTLPSEEATLRWLDAFWETMAREWGGIPALRMDKFLYLCRLYARAGFEWCRRGELRSAARQMQVVGLMQKCALSVEFERTALTNGLRFHVLDVWIDELVAVFGAEETPQMPVDDLLAPIRRLRDFTKDKTIRKRANEVLEDSRLAQLGVAHDPDSAASDVNDQDEPIIALEDEDGEWSGIDEG